MAKAKAKAKARTTMRKLIIIGCLVWACTGDRSAAEQATTQAAAGPATTGPAAVAMEPAQRLSAAARRLLAGTTTTRYAHQTAIDLQSGTVTTDCSGLLTWLLKNELPDHLAFIPPSAGHRRPLAADYQQAFAAGAKGWQAVGQVKGLRPGDVVAWRYAAPKPGGPTGHVVIIDSEARPDGPDRYQITVIDATSIPHDDDTRKDGDGLGRGTIRLRTRADGGAEAVQINRRSVFREQAFALARPVGIAGK